MNAEIPFPYEGPPELLEPVNRALHRVIDPEMALNIVDLGLVYGVEAGETLKVRITMTSAACPVSEFIVDEAAEELVRELGPGTMPQIELVWDPPWTPARMSRAAREAMGWD